MTDKSLINAYNLFYSIRSLIREWVPECRYGLTCKQLTLSIQFKMRMSVIPKMTEWRREHGEKGILKPCSILSKQKYETVHHCLLFIFIWTCTLLL